MFLMILANLAPRLFANLHGMKNEETGWCGTIFSDFSGQWNLWLHLEKWSLLVFSLDGKSKNYLYIKFMHLRTSVQHNLSCIRYWTFHKKEVPFFTLGTRYVYLLKLSNQSFFFYNGLFRFSICNTLTFHLGTIAFGSLIVGIIKFLRAM